MIITRKLSNRKFKIQSNVKHISHTGQYRELRIYIYIYIYPEKENETAGLYEKNEYEINRYADYTVIGPRRYGRSLSQ